MSKPTSTAREAVRPPFPSTPVDAAGVPEDRWLAELPDGTRAVTNLYAGGSRVVVGLHAVPAEALRAHLAEVRKRPRASSEERRAAVERLLQGCRYEEESVRWDVWCEREVERLRRIGWAARVWCKTAGRHTMCAVVVDGGAA